MASQTVSTSTAPTERSFSQTLRDSLKANAATPSPTSHLTDMDNTIDLTTPPPGDGILSTSTPGSAPKRSAEELVPNGSASVAPDGSLPKKAKASGDGDANIASAAKLVKAAPGEGFLCHQHRAQCSSALIRCTVIKGPQNIRCALKYCTRSLKKVYDQDAEEILRAGRARPGMDLSGHCSAEEANYIWKCPRCRGNCLCSMCRKKKGLAPMNKSHVTIQPVMRAGPAMSGANGLATAPENKFVNVAAAASSSNGCIEIDRDDDDLLDTSVKTFNYFGHHMARMSNGNASAYGYGTSVTAGPSGVPSPNVMGGPQIVAPKPKPMKQAALPRPLKAPIMMRPPALEMIDTKLPPPNVIERIWIYETLVRFDVVNVPKKILSSLDRFDRWPERDLQTLLERVLSCLAGLEFISRGQPRKPYVAAVEAFREHGGKIARGEAWAAAKAVYEKVRHAEVRELQDVEPEPLQVADTADDDKMPEDPGRTLLGDRSTRARRGAELAAIEKVKAISLSEIKGSQEEEDDEDDFVRRPTRSTCIAAPESDDEPPRKAAKNDWVRRSGRTRPTRDTSAKTKTDDTTTKKNDSKTKAKRGEEALTGPARSTRSNRATVVAVVIGSSGASSASSSSVSPPPESPRKGARASKPSREASPLPAPCFEERVAILSGLCELLLDNELVAEELKYSVDQVMALEKDVREEMRQDVRDFEEQMRELARKAPSIAQKEEYAKWKEEKAEKEREHLYTLLDGKVTQQIQLDALKLRTGPLGKDSDGNVYWQLSEYNEKLPSDPGGRWAWRLICLGRPETFEHASTAEEADKGKGKGKEEQPATFGPGVMSLDPCEYVEGAKFLGSGDPLELQRLIRWIRYRLELKEYQEAVRERAAATAAAAAANAAANGLAPPDTLTPSVPAYTQLTPADRKELKLRASWRRADVEALLQRLEHVKNYYQWHTSNLEELKHEPWPPIVVSDSEEAKDGVRDAAQRGEGEERKEGSATNGEAKHAEIDEEVGLHREGRPHRGLGATAAFDLPPSS